MLISYIQLYKSTGGCTLVGKIDYYCLWSSKQSNIDGISIYSALSRSCGCSAFHTLPSLDRACAFYLSSTKSVQ